MTPQRANEVIKTAQQAAGHGPWSDQLEKVMTREERVYVKRIWDEMPGYTAFIDALYRVARNQVPATTKEEADAHAFIKSHFVFVHVGDSQ